MNELAIVEYRDKGAGLQPVPAAGVPAGSPLWAVTSRLMGRLISQPPGELDTRRHPAWSLHLADVDGVPHWCFAVQAGMNGVLGAAGGCQFVFAPESWSPAQVWNTCVARVDAGQLTALPSAGSGVPAASAGPGQRDVGQLVEALAREEDRIAVAGDPQEVAVLFAAAFRVLPAGLIGRYLWTTCLLQPPFEARPVVAGRWPTDFRRSDDRGARYVDDWLRSRKPSAGPLGPRSRDAVDWLVREATTKRVTAPFAATARAQVDTMPALLELIARDHLPVSATDVPELLGSPEGQRRLLGEAPDLAAAWADLHPSRAMDRVVDPSVDPRLAWPLARGVMDHAVRTGCDVLLPPDRWASAGEGRGRLAAILTEHLSQEQIADWARQVYRGGPDARRALVDRRDGLEALGLSRVTCPDLFPIDLDGIVALLRDGRGLPHHVVEDLRAAPEPAAEIGRLLARVDLASLTPRDAAELVAAAHAADPWTPRAADTAARVVEQIVRGRWRSDPTTAGGWVRELLDALGEDAVGAASGTVCDAALAYLVSAGRMETPDGLTDALAIMSAVPDRLPAERTVLERLARERQERARRGWRSRPAHAAASGDDPWEPRASWTWSGVLSWMIVSAALAVLAYAGATHWFAS
jgi:hypothetical protein